MPLKEEIVEIRMSPIAQLAIGWADAKRERLISEGYDYHQEPATMDWVFRKPRK